MIRIIIGAITWLILIVIFILPLAILVSVKLVVTAARHVFPKPNQPRGNTTIASYSSLSPGDCMLAADSSTKKPIVNFGFLLVVQGNISVAKFREHFASTFITSISSDRDRYDKLFSHLVTFGGYVFRATNSAISLENHIMERKLENETTLQECLVRWLTSGYKEGLPSWEIIVIPLENEKTGIALKIHHALADGYSILHILDKLTNNASPYLVKDFTDGFATHVRQIVEAPLNLGRLTGNLEENSFRVVLPPDWKPEWMLSFTSFPLQTLKEIRRKYDVHMASLILAIVTGALRTFLLETKGMKEGDMPKNVLAGMTLPWPRHPSRIPSTLNKDKMCNHWVVAMLNLPLKGTNKIQRLKIIEENLCDFQSTGLDRFLERVMRPVMWALPSSLLGKMVSGDTGSGVGLTSLVGGDNYKLLNHDIERIHPFIAFHDNNPYLPLSCFTFTHSGKVELTMGAHPSVFKDQDTLDSICHKLCHNELEAIQSVQ